MASIEKRRITKGEWRYDVRHRVAGRAVTRTFKRRVDADAYKRTVEYDELHGAGIDPRAGRITLAERWELWWPSSVHLRESTRARNESFWRSRIEPSLGALRLDQIDRSVLRAWVASLQADGLAPATVHKGAQIVSKILAGAVDDGVLARNPAVGLELPRAERKEMRFLTPAQVDDLADAITPRHRALVYLGAYGGLRLGELLALRRDRVDLLHSRVDILTTLVEINGKLSENPPKTTRGRRSVPLPRIVVRELEEHLAALPADSSDFLFTAPEGGRVRAAAWRRRVWAPAVRAADLGPLRPHDLRHTAVAFWIAAGASPIEIAARAGHTSVVTVLDRYGHLLPGSAERVNDALDELAVMGCLGLGAR